MLVPALVSEGSMERFDEPIVGWFRSHFGMNGEELLMGYTSQFIHAIAG